MNQQVNIALQIIPRSDLKDAYAIVDTAIAVIKNSGVKHLVTPFETVMEGDYDELMAIVKQVQEKCYNQGMDSAIVYMKIQSNKKEPVRISDKLAKYTD